MQFAIHQTKTEALSKLIEKLAKTATKLKVEAPEAIVRGVQIWPAITTASGYLVKPQQTKTIVEFLGVSPKLEGGWEFLATLEHLGDTNVVRAIPGVTLPEAFQTSKPFCDHCQKIRGRKETFVVKSEAGEIKQVGRACLKDYLGHKSLEQIGWLHTLMAEIREFNDDEGSSHIPNQIGPIEMLIHAVAVIEAFGFFGREAAAKCDQLPTSDRVLANIWGLNETDKVQLTEAHLAKAEEVFAWIGTLSSDSQYNHNLKATALHKFAVGHRDAGLLTSAVFSYQKAMGQLAERKAKADQSKHFGTIGNRETMTLTVTKEMNVETAYGILWIFIMTDQAGNVAKWATGSKALESGATYEMKATIKAHTDWKGIAQTELARCKIIKQLHQERVAS